MGEPRATYNWGSLEDVQDCMGQGLHRLLFSAQKLGEPRDRSFGVAREGRAGEVHKVKAEALGESLRPFLQRTNTDNHDLVSKVPSRRAAPSILYNAAIASWQLTQLSRSDQAK